MHFILTHWGRVTHICNSKLTIVGSDNGLSPDRSQAISWINAGISLIGRLRTIFSGILIKIHAFSFKKMHFKMSSGKFWSFCLGLNVLSFFSSRITFYQYRSLRMPTTDNIHTNKMIQQWLKFKFMLLIVQGNFVTQSFWVSNTH